MKKILLLSILSIVIIAGCTQEPTGEFLVDQSKIKECTVNWQCTDWSSCIRTEVDSGVQNRNCTDVNSCNNNTDKPSESRVCGLSRIASKEPDKMALETSDLSKDKNWTTMENNIRSVEEVSQSERMLGFRKGYYVHYFSQYKESNNIEFIHVYHYVSIYPLANSAINMTYSFDTAKENYKVGSYYENSNKKISSISELDNPLIGDFSIAYNVIASDITGFKENIYTIAFTKWDVAEVITVEGSKLNYEFLRELAKKAEEKII
jgi:hypothetical protein